MASFISRILARLKGHKNKSHRTRRNRNRKLRLEPMEMRRLLAGDVASIAGNVFTDETDDGFGVGTDVAISGITVTLYRDGGDSVFDFGSGGTDDTLVTTDVSDGTGAYNFDNLTAGTYFIQQSAATGQVQRTTETVKTVTISEANAAGVAAQNIDTFGTNQAIITTSSGTATGGSTIATAGSETLGNERDIQVNYVSGTSSFSAEVSGGFFNVGGLADTAGNAILSYDGNDGDFSTLAHNILNVDLTTSGATAFHMLAGSEETFLGSGVGNTITIDVFSGAANFSRFSMALPVTAGGAATENVNILFSDFTIPGGGGTGADFTAVTAMRMQVDIAAGTDAQIDLSQTVAPFVDTNNFANLNPMSIGNLVFSDPNNNATLDVGESGISGVTVQLYQDNGATVGSFDGTDTLVDTQVTNASGEYVFQNLLPGEYIVLVPDSQFATNADPLFGFLSSGTDPAPDPDAVVTNGDDNGSNVTGGVATAAITLASGTEPITDGDTDTNTDLGIDFGFVPQIDLEVTKNAAPTTVDAGNNLVYTILVQNNGDATANNVVVTDNLPDLAPDALVIVSADSASGNGTVVTTGPSTGEITVSYASLAPGASDTITITVTVPTAAAAATALANVATVTGDGVDTNTANNTSTANVDITRSAVLTITKTDTPDPAVVGGTLTYEIVVSNTGPSSATNVVISDTIPTGLTVTNTAIAFSDPANTTGNVGELNGVVTGNVPTLGIGDSATITVTATIDSAFAGSTIPNAATADADEATLVTANASTTVNPQVDLAITKADSVDPVSRGGQLTYTLDVVNNGPSTATNVQIIDTLPADVSFVSASGGTNVVQNGNTITISLADLAAAGTDQVTILVDVSQTAGASFTNSAEIRSTETIALFDTDTTNNTATQTTATQASVDLQVQKTDSVDPATPGEVVTYTITATNAGPADATQIVVTDNLPDGIRVTGASSTVGTVNIPASAQDTVAANNDDLVVNVGALASGASATIIVNAVVLAQTTGTLSNVVTISSTDTSLVETDSTNNTVTETTALTPSVDLAVTKLDSVDPAIAGQNMTYTMTVTNGGPSTATGVTLTDTLPAGVTATSTVSTTQGTASVTSGVLTANVGTLDPSGTATITVLVTVNEDTRGTLTNTATVSANETEVDTSNNSATATTQVNGNVDLVVTKTDNLTTVAAGGTLSYTVVVTNNGPSEATNVVLSDTLPSNLSFTNGSTTVGTLSNNGNAVTVNVGTLASGASATITLNASVLAAATGTLSNTATATAAETETNSSDNSATDTTEVAVPGSIAGTVYIDANRNGVQDSGDTGISGVTITLTGTDILNASINRTAITDASGNYTFDNLLPGTYQLVETQPAGFGEGTVNVGTGATGTAGTNQITTIDLASGANATAFNFGEVLSPLSKRRLLASSVAGD